MPDVFLITGDDHALISETARKCFDECVGENPDEFAMEIIKESDERGAEDTINELLNALMTPSFLGGHKTLWLQNFSAFDQENAKGTNPVAVSINKLIDIIKTEFPAETTLVISGPKASGAKSLHKTIKKEGTVHVCNKPELNDRNWEANVRTIIQQRAQERGMKLTPKCVSYLIEVVGNDTGRIIQELEKVYCYAGESPQLEQVQAVCVGDREAVFYALNNSLGQRDLNGCFRVMKQLLGHTKDPEGAVIGLMRQASNLFNHLLQAKLLMLQMGLKSPGQLNSQLKAMSDDDKDAFAGNEVVTMHPYRAQMIAEQSARYSGRELVSAIGHIAQADKLMVSSPLSRKLVLENLIFQIVLKKSA